MQCVWLFHRPQEIDEAARRRLVKRLYIPLPDGAARKKIVSNLLRQQAYSLTPEELEELAATTDGTAIEYIYIHPLIKILLPQAILGQIWLTCVVRQPTDQSEKLLRPFNTLQLMRYVEQYTIHHCVYIHVVS